MAAVLACRATWAIVHRVTNSQPKSSIARVDQSNEKRAVAPKNVETVSPSVAIGTPPPAPVVQDSSTRPTEPANKSTVAEPQPRVSPPNSARPEPRMNQIAKAPMASEPLIPRPVARAALGFVGADADASEIWAWAINDPNLPAKDRQDLIEDLNEEGFPDPKNITVDDVPLIVSRLAIIEELAPDSMDDVNLAAFAEAYKDLANMLLKLSRQ